jgi:hypothetical protein
MLEGLKDHWAGVVQIGAWLLGIVAGFVIAPKMGGPATEQSIWNLVQFIVNILVILMFIFTIKYGQTSHLRGWIILTLVTLVFGLVAYFSYMNKQGSCTCKYYSRTVLIGTQLSRPEREGATPCEELLKSHAGAVEEIWTRASINHCRLMLGISYVGTVPLFAICLISALQSLSIAKSKPQNG